MESEEYLPIKFKFYWSVLSNTEKLYLHHLHPNYFRSLHFHIHYLIQTIEIFIDTYFSVLVTYIKEYWILLAESMRQTVVALLEERSGVIMTYFDLIKEGQESFQSLTIFLVALCELARGWYYTLFWTYTLGFTCLEYTLRMIRLMINVTFQLSFPSYEKS